ncbi:unnamed protein product [Rotaria sp. Silwood1]|nr:unnamed protein product [Rotaria sp. Silwood1]CAF3512505.1 unnamed protein product [Rotaria sp. Silwood1]CAF4834715.1 unnamed protein product [Rotaria sp. Silwood1]CAF4992855.1 unnamed protein product [Rotaria sp. Silwood1]
MKRIIDDIINQILPVKSFRCNVTCLLDLPDDILLMICRYLSTYDVLHCFYTPERLNSNFHCLVYDYYTKINLGSIAFDKRDYLFNLFSHPNNPLRPKSLILNNEHGFYLDKHYFFSLHNNIIQSVLINLTHLTLINCTSTDLNIIKNYYKDFTKLEYFHATVHECSTKSELSHIDQSDIPFNKLLFAGRMCTLHIVIFETFYGLSLYKTLKPHQSLRHFNIVLQKIDDLYILISGLVPNIETLIVQLRESGLSTRYRPQCQVSCPRLIDFTLLESSTNINLDDIESILGYMPNLRKLTLSIRDTPDSRFTEGSTMEHMLMKQVPHLDQFDYTMTHRIGNKIPIDDFVLWPMNIVFYENENTRWIHLFSLPWPSNQQDKREVPIINGKYNISITSDVKYTHNINHINITTNDEMLEINEKFSRVRELTTCLSINIELPRKISKLILSGQAPVSSINSIPQEYIYNLVVERRLIDENEINVLAHQFPRVKNLELLFPLEKTSCLRCLQTLFRLADNTGKRCFWSDMINFHTKFTHGQPCWIWNNDEFHHWLLSNTDLKFRPNQFYISVSGSIFSIWL